MNAFEWVMCIIGIADIISIILIFVLIIKKQNYTSDGNIEVRYNNEERYGIC